MLSLILDASSEKSFILLCRSKGLSIEGISSIFLQGGASLSAHIVKEIENLLQKEDVSLSSLDFLGLGVGPGSYTGLRVGASVIKTISYAYGLPIVEFCSLEAFIPKEEGSFVSMMDARMGGVYFSKGERKKEIVEMQRASIGNPLFTNKRIVTPSEGSLRKKYPDCEVNEMDPNVEHIGKICLEKWARKDTVSHEETKLLYLA
ncbi:MAG: tRNA (adenosine(37)-N6)-threonylcarbamoyltransferase complex dimerization subunit type 1 TsaB [Chlamydiota bacterium]